MFYYKVLFLKAEVVILILLLIVFIYFPKPLITIYLRIFLLLIIVLAKNAEADPFKATKISKIYIPILTLLLPVLI